jgi:hypothetical protein
VRSCTRFSNSSFAFCKASSARLRANIFFGLIRVIRVPLTRLFLY